MIHFPISGVETYWWLPVAVAFAISSVTSTGGVSGAFLILPFQLSVLRFTGPAASPTNLVFNIVAIPPGVYRYWREGRMAWPIAWTTILGTLPGIFLGALIRINYLPDPRRFKVFVGLVLLYLGIRLLMNVISKSTGAGNAAKSGNRGSIVPLRFDLREVGYEYQGERYFASTWKLMLLSFVVGVIGGTYGIGGGAIISPFLVTFFALPVHTIAGATLLGTFVTSIAGVVFYSAIAPFYAHTGLAIAPDWALGALFGIGGAMGTYLGARLQRFMPARLIKGVLACCLFFLAVRYVGGIFR